MEAPELAGATGVLLDPSCSGSGTVHSRMDWLLPSAWQGAAADAGAQAAATQVGPAHRISLPPPPPHHSTEPLQHSMCVKAATPCLLFALPVASELYRQVNGHYKNRFLTEKNAAVPVLSA